MAGLSHTDFIEKFTHLVCLALSLWCVALSSVQISTGKHLSSHQFVLKPVSGEGRVCLFYHNRLYHLSARQQVVINHTLDKDVPRFDVQLLFDEIGVLLDDNQYRDAISLVDMYHFYMRQHQVSLNSMREIHL